MRDKVKLTYQLLSNLPDGVDISFDEAYHTWWHSGRPQSGLRLTMVGYNAFRELLKLEEYVFEMPPKKPFRLKELLLLDQRLEYPYWLGGKQGICISFFGSKEAMLAQLYGDLCKFLSNYNTR